LMTIVTQLASNVASAAMLLPVIRELAIKLKVGSSTRSLVRSDILVKRQSI
jgi:di/tricarboxylate transporter